MATMMEAFRSFFKSFQENDSHYEPTTEVLWKVHNFSFCHLQKGQKIESPVFHPFKDSICYLELYPKGETEDSAMDVHLLRHYSSNMEPEVMTFSIASAKDAALEYITSDFESEWDITKRREIIASLIVEKNKSQSYDMFISEDTLTVRCVMKHPYEKFLCPKSVLLRSRFCVRRFCSTLEVRDFEKKSFDLRKEHSSDVRITGRVFKSYVGFSICNDTIKVHIQPYKMTENCYVTCKVLVIDSNGVPLSLLLNEYLFTDYSNEDRTWTSCHPFNTAFFLSNKELYIPEDTLTCVVELTYTYEVHEEEIRYGPKSLKSRFEESSSVLRCLKNDIQLLLEDEISCDVHLKVGSESVSVHKSILRARSSVFKAMFDNDTEKDTNTVFIEDMDMETLRRMVKFMYTDTVEGLNWNSALNLYYAADKYDISLLKRKCAEYLEENMNQSNIYEVLVFSDMHDDAYLKKSASDFIFTQKSTLVSSEDWKSIERNYPNLALDVLRELCCKAMGLNEDTIVEVKGLAEDFQ